MHIHTQLQPAVRKFTGGGEAQVTLLEKWGGGLTQCLGKEAMYSHRF